MRPVASSDSSPSASAEPPLGGQLEGGARPAQPPGAVPPPACPGSVAAGRRGCCGPVWLEPSLVSAEQGLPP